MMNRVQSLCVTVGLVLLAPWSAHGWEWHGTQMLEPSVNFSVSWFMGDGNVTLQLSADTTAWIGFGISESTTGSMLGADVVTVSPNTDAVSGGTIAPGADAQDVVDVTDMFVPWASFPLREGTAPFPFRDVCQSWDVLEADLTAQSQRVVITRSLDANGDSQDRDIVNGTNRVIYAWGNASDSAATVMAYHGSRRGATALNFATGATTLSLPETANETLSLHLSNYTIPAQVTTYTCQRWDIGEVYGAKDIVAVEPLLDETRQREVHHLLLHSCSQYYGMQYTNNPQECVSPLGTCTTLIYGWAVGGGPLVLPDDVAFRDHRYLVIEMHYDNPDMLSGLVDNSGVILHFADEQQTHEATSLILGDVITRMESLAAGEDDLKRVSVCPEECTSTFTEPLNVFASFLHMHSFGKTIWTSHYDSSGGLQAIENKGEFWNFEFQQITEVSYQIEPGDRLETHCVYDTNKREADVDFGPNSLDEMCFDFAFVWPASALNNVHVCGYATDHYSFCGVENQPIAIGGPNAGAGASLRPTFGTAPGQCSANDDAEDSTTTTITTTTELVDNGGALQTPLLAAVAAAVLSMVV